MKTKYTVLAFFVSTMWAFPQYPYEPSAEHPFGLPNPEAPQQIVDFAPLIGECDCESVSRNKDQSWSDPVRMIWRFKFIMNGMAVQDETLKADGKHSGSIRQFISDSTRWYVHYYSSGSPSTQLPVWEGNKNQEGKIVLYREQKAPNGTEGFYRLTFSDIDENGFKWAGEWVSTDESIVYPTWKIDCKRRKLKDNEKERQKILEATKKFSKAYMNADYDALANAYTENGKIFPNNSEIIVGRVAIKKRWLLPEDVKIVNHVIEPQEINFIGDYYAYDYGYYHGSTKKSDGSIEDWKGKYVVVWKKVGAVWKMYLDIWNRVKD